MENRLRQLILDVAAGNDRIGSLEESLKWGQPSFTPTRKGVGSSVRIQPNRDGAFALMFICHTGLVDRFREIYPDELSYEGNRAIVVRNETDLDDPALAHCIAMALTYKLDKR